MILLFYFAIYKSLNLMYNSIIIKVLKQKLKNEKQFKNLNYYLQTDKFSV